MENFIFGLLSLVLLASNTWLLAFLSRRLLGVPVGWPRLIIVSLLAGLSISGVLFWVADQSHMIDRASDDLNASVGVPEALFLTAFVILIWVITGPVALLGLEIIAPTGTLRGPIEILRDLPARYRRSRRYASVLRIASKHGLSRYLGGGRRAKGGSANTVGTRLRFALTEGGVTFVKLGQMMATRPDLVGPEMAAELSSLQADVPAEPWARVRATIEAETKRPISEVFASIDEVPLAAASVGQVYQATLLDGSEVVVKVQRSGAEALTKADLDIITRLAAWLERSTTWGRLLGTKALAAGFAESLREELDYTIEAANVTGIRASAQASRFAGRELVVVPKVYAEFTSQRLLVMERVEGTPISRANDQLDVLFAEERDALAEALVGVVLRQLLVDGIFHADLHAGNVLLREDATLALLDFGSVGRLDNVTRSALSRLLLAIKNNDSIAATDALITVLDRPAGLDQRALEREVGSLLLRFGPGGSLGAAVPQLMGTLLEHGFSVPAQVAAAFRALGALEGTVQQIAPGIDLVSATETAGKNLVADWTKPASIRASAEEQLWQLLPILQRLPRRIDEISRALADGELSVQVRVLADPSDRAFVTGLVSQLVTTAAAAISAIIATWLLTTSGGPRFEGGFPLFPLLSTFFYVIAVGLGVRVLASAFFGSDTKD